MSPGEGFESFAFTAENEDRAKAHVAKYPEGRQASAVLPLLALAQGQCGGWLPKAALDYVAGYLEMPTIRVYEVASFYDMLNTKPVGRIQIRVCTTTPCWLCGSDDVVKACRDVLGIEVGESTGDGRFFLREFECLGACANAPMMWIDDHYYEDLTYDSTTAIIEALKRGEQPTPGSQTGRKASMAVGGKTTLLDDPTRKDIGGEKAGDETPAESQPGSDVEGQTADVAQEDRPADEAGDVGSGKDKGRKRRRTAKKADKDEAGDRDAE